VAPGTALPAAAARGGPGAEGPAPGRGEVPARGPAEATRSGLAVVPTQRGDLPARPGTVPAGPTRRLALTERELQVLRGMADGASNAEIGRQLFVSEDTVKTHARRLFRKLGARDRAHAVAVGFRTGLLS
jgi:ATP/maltotriose-dependent transcriptional regulator MalT